MSTTLCYLLRPDEVPRCSWQQHFLCFLGYRELHLSVSPALPFVPARPALAACSSACAAAFAFCHNITPSVFSFRLAFLYLTITIGNVSGKYTNNPPVRVRRVVIQRMKFSCSGDLFRLNITFSLQQLGNQYGSSGSASHSVVRQADELIVV